MIYITVVLHLFFENRIVANFCTTLNKTIVKYVHSEEIAVTSYIHCLRPRVFLRMTCVQSIYRRWILAPCLTIMHLVNTFS